jgi:endonuclease/exonuclease/phosphatase family metal-dependent hydrolase
MKSDKTLRVMTWNVWGRYGDWRERMPIVTDTLRNAHADVIALQEVWAEAGGGRVDQVKMLADALGYYCHSYMNIGPDDDYTGNALLARWPMTSKAYNLLPSNPLVATERRTAVYAITETPFGSIPIISTHLSWQRNLSNIRQQQTQALAVLATELASFSWPPILMGDFNSDPESDEIRALTGKRSISHDLLVFQDAWEQGGNGSAGHTWTPDNSHYPASRRMSLAAMPWLRRRLDYIFVGLPDGRSDAILPIQVERALLAGIRADSEMEGSDHYAVIADLMPHHV